MNLRKRSFFLLKLTKPVCVKNQSNATQKNSCITILFFPSVFFAFREIEGVLVKKGPLEPQIDNSYVFTPSIRRNIQFLSQVITSSHYPILLEGETSTGKTSIITHLAKSTGNNVFRINNHENTDVQVLCSIR